MKTIKTTAAAHRPAHAALVRDTGTDRGRSFDAGAGRCGVRDHRRIGMTSPLSGGSAGVASQPQGGDVVIAGCLHSNINF
ncbi:hypothetical protein GCM10022416_59100 [Actinomadura keratinilytica]|uniref:Uncharacterized protein n=1 Tax=Actinomadura keratinilytica TaxID=547461 RepID=A0ABP7ZGV5_9ACTN